MTIPCNCLKKPSELKWCNCGSSTTKLNRQWWTILCRREHQCHQCDPGGLMRGLTGNWPIFWNLSYQCSTFFFRTVSLELKLLEFLTLWCGCVARCTKPTPVSPSRPYVGTPTRQKTKTFWGFLQTGWSKESQLFFVFQIGGEAVNFHVSPTFSDSPGWSNVIDLNKWWRRSELHDKMYLT